MFLFNRNTSDDSDCEKQKDDIEQKKAELEAEAVQNAIAEGKLRRKARDIENTLLNYASELRQLRQSIGPPLKLTVNVVDDYKLNKTIYTQTRNIDEYVSVFADRFLHEQSIEYDFVSAFAARDMDEVESGTYADKVDKLTPLKLLTQLNGIVYLQLRLSNGKASSILRF